MKKIKLTKRILATGLVLALSLGTITGCQEKYPSGIVKDGGYTQEEASTTKVMVIGDYDIYMDEILIYAMQDAYINGVTSESWESKDSTRKEAILSSIREGKIIYDVAIHNNCELGDADKDFVNTSVNNFKMTMGDDILTKYGISDEVINKVFTEQAIVSKFENDMQNDMGQTITDDLNEMYKDFKFFSYYYMMFPTVEVNENNEPATNADGSYIYLSDVDKAQAKKNAEDAIAKIEGGTAYADVAAEYGITPYCLDRVGYVDPNAEIDDYTASIMNLKDGECSEVIENTLGYIVAVMIDSDDENLREGYISSLASEGVSSEYETLRQQWLATIPVDTEKDMEGTVWEDFDLKSLIIDMETGGIL